MIRKFRKKPVVIEAIQWSGNSNKQEIDSFVGRVLNTELESETAYLAGKGAPIFSLLIETKEGIMKAFPGDWIIKEPFPTGDRDFYPCKNDIFINTYDAILYYMDAAEFIKNRHVTERDVQNLTIRFIATMMQEYHEQQVKNCTIPDVIKSVCDCGIPQPDADRECCTICDKLIYEDD